MATLDGTETGGGGGGFSPDDLTDAFSPSGRQYLFYDGSQWLAKDPYEQVVEVGTGEEAQAINVSSLAADASYVLAFHFQTKVNAGSLFFPKMMLRPNGSAPSNVDTIAEIRTSVVEAGGESTDMWTATSLNDGAGNTCQLVGQVKFRTVARSSPFIREFNCSYTLYDGTRPTGNQRHGRHSIRWEEYATDITSIQFWLDIADATFEEGSKIWVLRED